MASRHGGFAVALRALRWRRPARDDDGAAREVWACVTLESALPDGVWFAADDDNAASASVALTGDEHALEYAQSSRALPLTTESLTALLHAQLNVALYCGATRSRASDELWGEARVAFMPALLGDRLQETVRIASANANDEEISIDLTVQCDAELADYALGARVLHLHSLSIVRPPPEWTLASANDEEAVRLCAAPDRNTATYELEIPLPEFSDTSDERTSDVIRFSGGKLQYTPNPEAVSEAEDGAGGLTGEWCIAFPAAVVHKLYLKSVLPRLVDFLEVEKTVTAVLRRLNVEPAGRVTASISLNLHALTSPGQTRVTLETPLKKISAFPKELLEQELAGASSNDEKKRLQALIGDYDAAIAQPAAALTTSLRTAKTRVECAIQIVGKGPLVLEPPVAPTPTKPMDELITPRDLGDEYDQRKDVVADLRTEIRRVVLTVLREYEDVDETTSTTVSRDEKRQRIVFKLNSQGAYHEFKEKLKKRIVPMIRDQFADELADTAAQDDEEEDAEPQQPPDTKTRANTRKKAYFASVYATLMDEVQRVLHETFYAAAVPPTLETTHADLQPRNDAKVTQRLTTLGLQALENEVNGDVDKSEALHLDRIAYAEARAVELPQAAPALRPTLGTVWVDYAKFCLGQGALDKAGGGLRQSLSLEPRCVDALVAYGALLCELQDFTAADVAVTNAVSEALAAAKEAAVAMEADALRLVVTAHALLALCYSESHSDATGNLVLFELLKAQRALRRLREISSEMEDVAPCLSSVWIHLAAALHALRLRGGTQTALRLADQFLRARDALSREDRVLQRAILADVVSRRAGEGDRATALLRDALEIDPTHAFAWFALGKTYLQLESQTPAAIECLQRSLEYKHKLRADQRLAVYVHLGLVLLQSAQFALAKATFLSACEEFPLASTWLGVGIASLRLEQWDPAQVALAEANRLDATSPEVWGYLALHALSVAPPHEQRARQCVAQALRFELSNPALLRELSSGFVALDRLEDAERLLRRALVFQDSSLTRRALADVLAAQHCAEDALAQYKRSLDESQDDAPRRALLDKCAALLVTLGRPDEAAECRAMAAQLLAGDLHDNNTVVEG